MYYKLNQKEQEKIKKASDITMSDYELEGDFIPVDSLICCIEDLLVEVDVLQEKVEDLKEEMRELRNGYND